MRKEWQPSTQMFGGYRCVEHVRTKELSLIGRHGEIWENDAYTYKASVFSARIAKRYLRQEQWPIEPGDEILIKFPAEDLPLWVKRLQVPSKSSSQADIANRGRNLDDAKSNIVNPTGKNSSLTAKRRARRGGGSQSIPHTGNRLNLPPGSQNLGESKPAETESAVPGGDT